MIRTHELLRESECATHYTTEDDYTITKWIFEMKHIYTNSYIGLTNTGDTSEEVEAQVSE